MRVLCLFLFLIIISGACSSASELQTATSPQPSTSSPDPQPKQDENLSSTSANPTDDDQQLINARHEMVETGVVGWGITDPRVVEVMEIVPRHKFVPEDLQSFAYLNRPLPIGYGQTISQPFIVALMTQAMGVKRGDRVLEIGTGSGYQAAVLAELGVEVFTIEIVKPLADEAKARFEELDYLQIITRHADGYFGWADESPFDAIMVTAAPDHVPRPLLEQLKIEGVLVIPVGPVGGYQELWKITRIDADTFQSVSLGGVQFVPFTRAD